MTVCWRGKKNNKRISIYLRIVGICLFAFNAQLICAQKQNYNKIDKNNAYTLHLPKGYTSTKSYPLIINYHGMGSKAAKHEHYCKMDAVADKEGFIVVYPQSRHFGWNAGLGFASYTDGPDDIGNLNKLLDTLESKYAVDKKRVYATGVSLGGSLAYRVGCEMGHRIAAIASVSGLMTDSTVVHCNAQRNIPVLHMHGTNDFIMSYDGMQQANGVEELIKMWTLKNQCKLNPDTIQIPKKRKSNKTSVQLIKYSDCAGTSQVWLYKITNGGHTWPGVGKKFRFMGRKNTDFNGSQAIWDFFKQFTLDTGK